MPCWPARASGRCIPSCSAAFSPDALASRINDSACKLVITADEGLRGGRKVPLKGNTDKALETCPSVSTVIVVKRTGGDIGWSDGRDVWYEDVTAAASPDCPPEEMNAEDPLFILYTSGRPERRRGFCTRPAVIWSMRR